MHTDGEDGNLLEVLGQMGRGEALRLPELVVRLRHRLREVKPRVEGAGPAVGPQASAAVDCDEK